MVKVPENYISVKQRIANLKEAYPLHKSSILTQATPVIVPNEGFGILVKASILIDEKVVAEAHAFTASPEEEKEVEKTETTAIGRALTNAGFPDVDLSEESSAADDEDEEEEKPYRAVRRSRRAEEEEEEVGFNNSRWKLKEAEAEEPGEDEEEEDDEEDAAEEDAAEEKTEESSIKKKYTRAELLAKYGKK